MGRSASCIAVPLGLFVLTLGCGQPAERPGDRTYGADGHLLVEVKAPARPPNLVVLVIDALRADALPQDGVPRRGDPSARMPFYSSLAARGVTFTNAASAAPWTLPSLTSLLTGMLPSEHGQLQVQDGWHLPTSVTTYAEVLRTAYGYETAALANGEWYQHSGASLLQGFAYRKPVFALQGAERSIGAWNRQRDATRPFFLFLHTFEAHDPYGAANHPWPPQRIEPVWMDRPLSPEGVRPASVFRQAFLSTAGAQVLHMRLGPALSDVLQRYKWRGYAEEPDRRLATDLRSAYWSGVRWVDGLLARTHGLLETMGLLDNTLLVVTSDHGEAFGEHGSLAHGLRLYDELVRVPLVMVGPGEFTGGRIVQEDVGLVDVVPTFLDWAGLVEVSGVTGRSAMEVVRGGSWCRPVVSEERLGRVNTGEDVDAVRISARTQRWKYIVTLDHRTFHVHEEAYDLLLDPEELDDLARGTGRLPADHAFDPCLCAAVEAVRERVWERKVAVDGEDYSTPDAASADRAATPRPAPCNGGA